MKTSEKVNFASFSIETQMPACNRWPQTTISVPLIQIQSSQHEKLISKLNLLLICGFRFRVRKQQLFMFLSPLAFATADAVTGGLVTRQGWVAPIFNDAVWHSVMLAVCGKQLRMQLVAALELLHGFCCTMRAQEKSTWCVGVLVVPAVHFLTKKAGENSRRKLSFSMLRVEKNIRQKSPFSNSSLFALPWAKNILADVESCLCRFKWLVTIFETCFRPEQTTKLKIPK